MASVWRTHPDSEGATPRAQELLGVSGDTVIVQTREGLRGLDTQTGAARWTLGDARDPAPPTGGLIMARAADGTRWLAVEAQTGAVRWTLEADRVMQHGALSAVLAEGVLVVIAADGPDEPILGLDPETGVVRWRELTLTPELEAAHSGAPWSLAASGGMVIVSSLGHVAGRDPHTGLPRWRRDAAAVPSDCDPQLSPLLDAGLAAAPDCRALDVLDPLDGHPLRRHVAPDRTDRMRAVGERQILLDSGGRLRALDAWTGLPLWQSDEGVSLLNSTVHEDALWLVHNARLARLDLRTGKLTHSRWAAEASLPLLAVHSDGPVDLIALLPDGGLVGLDVEAEVADADRSWQLAGQVIVWDELDSGDDGALSGVRVRVADQVVPVGADGRFEVTVPAGGVYRATFETPPETAGPRPMGCSAMAEPVTGAAQPLRLTWFCPAPC